ncbi:TetR/AcrR family transcriptional regulator [Nonomuraea rubra]|uniref:TetR/AcrR family transcriptional regulator n=1 Tax=Nonomuraea rubra TaxID=46180 RepID=UPI003609D5F7
MSELEKGPTGRRRGRGARERILSASQQLFREQGINRTGMDQLCAAAQVSKRTAYQHFTGKDELVAEYLRRFDPSVLSGVFDRTDLTPRERLLAAFDVPPTTPCAPTSAPPSNSTTPSTPHPSTRATTRKPSPRGWPTPPAKPAPPSLNSSASSSRCSSTAPRPGPGFSTPTPFPPPPPSPPSSSTTPSPRHLLGSPATTAEPPGLLPFRWEADDGPIAPRRPEGDVEFGVAGAVDHAVQGRPGWLTRVRTVRPANATLLVCCSTPGTGPPGAATHPCRTCRGGAAQAHTAPALPRPRVQRWPAPRCARAGGPGLREEQAAVNCLPAVVPALAASRCGRIRSTSVAAGTPPV